MGSLGIYIYSANKDNFIFSFPNYAFLGGSSTMGNRPSGEREPPGLIPDLRGKPFIFRSLSIPYLPLKGSI